MTLYLDEDEYFSMNAYVQTLGEQTIALSGYLIEHRSDGTYIAPLIPDLFYGADGNQLHHSWRQNFTATGDQMILSRSGGHPEVPSQELYWRKISENHVAKEGGKTITTQVMVIPSWVLPVAILGVVAGAFILYKLAK